MPRPISIQKLPYLPDASAYFRALAPLGNRVWLDSGKPNSHYGRYDILAADPTQLLCNPSMEAINRAIDTLKQNVDFKDLGEVEPPFMGGALGYLNYEYRHHHFGIESDFDHCGIFGIFEWALIQDHQKRTSYVLFLPSMPAHKQENIYRLLRDDQTTQTTTTYSIGGFVEDDPAKAYHKAFEHIQDYIASGDCYQINFAKRFSSSFTGDPSQAYLDLRNALPSPFSAFFEFNDEVILSISPERFIAVKDGTAVTQPIKGTAPRGRNIAEDDANANFLLNSDKNRAENLMIVDLLRNDFSQSCKPFSVKTPSLFDLESFANVHHLVSTVTGELAEQVSPLTFLAECFPGGSITGAPKKRAMEIIAELETKPREIYCGSVVYQSCHGNLDSSITIRTLKIAQDRIYCWGGGGIVYDSEERDEYQEVLNKVHLLMNTLEENKA